VLDIISVDTARQWRAFHHLPHRIYADDPNWVPPLLLERKMHFSARHNPFFQHAEAKFWVAYRSGIPIGRISAQIDRLHLDRYNDGTGHFGFIEAVDDPETFSALLDTAESWLRQAGMVRVLGPVSFSMWDQPGLLVEGFDSPPSVMMGHALPYFAARIEAAGYGREQDLLTYEFDVRVPWPPQASRLIERIRNWPGIVIRNARKSAAAEDIAIIHDIINDAWSDNWGFVPMTKAEIDEVGSLIKFLVQDGDIAIAEYKGRPVAFSAIFPNLNEAIRDLDGRLAPFGWIKLLWRLKVAGLQSARMPLMGVRKSFQTSQMGAALALSVIEATRAFNEQHGKILGELSWIHEQNHRVRHIIELVGGVQRKRYRIYAKRL
jgi:hypothetical protein